MVDIVPIIYKKIGHELYEVTEEYSIDTEYGSIVVNKGFTCDFASVPVGLIISHDDKTIKYPSIIHDYLYSSGCKNVEITRKQADKIFYDLIREEGMGWVMAKSVYLAVRSFGFMFFRK